MVARRPKLALIDERLIQTVVKRPQNFGSRKYPRDLIQQGDAMAFVHFADLANLAVWPNKRK